MAKPSSIKVVRAKKNRLICPIGFVAITLFGVIYTREDKFTEKINKTDNIDSVLECHETIHVRQAKNMKDSWFRFYLEYVWEWICNIPLIFINVYAPYRFMPTELEAYKHENDYQYPDANPDGCTEWREFKKFKLKEKMELARQYYKQRKTITFNSFLKIYLK